LKTASAIPLFLFPGFSKNSFEKKQAATCRFSKQFCENPENVPVDRKKGIKIKTQTVNTLGVLFKE
jgi:hypothetical protein